MKILGFISLWLLFQINGMAQSDFRVGVTAGFNYAFATAKENGSSSNYNPRAGFTTGVFAEIPFSNGKLAFQPGLQYTPKGGSFDYGGSDVKVQTRFHYLEIPMLFMVKEKAADISLFAGIGPSVGFGLGGREKVDRQYNEAVLFGGDPDKDDYKMLDFAGMILFGIEFKNQSTISFYYNRTLNDLSLDQTVQFRNQYVGVRAGFVLWRRK